MTNAAQAIYTLRAAYTARSSVTQTAHPRIKLVFNTSGLHFCMSIIDAVKENCDIILSPLVATHFPQKVGYSVEAFTNSDKDHVYGMIRRHLDKELATNYRRGRKTSHAGEFESIALAKRLGVAVVFHDQRARQWAKLEKVQSLHPIDLPDIFHRKLPKEKMRQFLEFHCKMKYEPACEKLRKLQISPT